MVLTQKNYFFFVCIVISVKSRSSTPQCEFVKPGVTDALHLLQKWNLFELQNIFRGK